MNWMIKLKLKFKITVCLVTLLLFGVTSYVYLVNEANGEKLIMSSAKLPLFLSQCVEETAIQPLDTDGKLNVSVWNIYKQQRSSWNPVLTELVKSSELVLLQEAKLSTGLKNFLQENDHQVLMAKAFKVFKTPIGVMNLAKVAAESACAYQAIEPWIRFAKSALVSKYPLSNGETLLVVNLHGINFAWRLKAYRQQFSLLAEQIKAHQGPVIMAGDFNTWRQGRVDMIGEFTKQLGMTEAKYVIDKRNRVFGLALDHLYYSGLDLIEAHATPTQASDHNPIQASFSLIKKN
ncbi:MULTISPECIES: endonuclease/exonuclease/phosphatase family protein [unclassified Shewanella]|uniref:endonuclease/exonuclease/phosphatase family protein n=2 Tax=Shewanella TaxID=22 RepID=UPI002DD6809D|nr:MULTISPECIES: endonuclease/exonuclease/phosphatase family protein [unclassified Shewanella]